MPRTSARSFTVKLTLKGKSARLVEALLAEHDDLKNPEAVLLAALARWGDERDTQLEAALPSIRAAVEEADRHPERLLTIEQVEANLAKARSNRQRAKAAAE